MSEAKTKTFEVPEHWLNALLRNNLTELDEQEQREFHQWCRNNPEKLNIVSVAEEPHTGYFEGCLCPCVMCTAQLD